MIVRYDIVLRYDKDSFFQGYSYRFYAMLLGMMPSELAEELHSQGFTPVSQWVEWNRDEKQLCWHINVFNEYLAEALGEKIDRTKSFELFNPHIIMPVIELRKCIIENPFDLRNEKLISADAHTIKVQFLTTTTYKHNGHYAMFPSEEFVVKSLMQSWNNVWPMRSVHDEDAEKMLIQGLRIVKYRLSSSYYPLKRVKISGFIGEIILSLKLSVPMKELLIMLLNFGLYSGVGVKTALGMGAFSVEGM